MPIVSSYSDGLPVVSFSLLGHSGVVLAGREPDREFYPASTIKLGVLLAAMIAVDAGRIALDDVLISRRTFATAAPGGGEFGFTPDEVDPQFPEPGTQMPLSDVLGAMIYRSSNEATNMAAELLGFPAINEALELAGLVTTRMARLIGDVEARDLGIAHRTTSLELTRLMRAIATGAHTSPGSTAFMREVLEAQEFPPISGGLPPGTRWGSKSGWVTGITHDVAYIGDPDSPGCRYLAVCVRGYEDEQGTELVAALTAGLVAAGALPAAASTESEN